MAHNRPPGGRSTYYYVARGGAEEAALELETNPALLDLRCCCTEGRSLALPDLRRLVDALARHRRIKGLALEGFRRAVTHPRPQPPARNGGGGEGEEERNDDRLNILLEDISDSEDWMFAFDEGSDEESDDDNDAIEIPAQERVRLLLQRRQQQQQLINAELDRLFGAVLPNHPSLTERVFLQGCESCLVGAFATSLLSAGGRANPQPLRCLTVSVCPTDPLEPGCAEALARAPVLELGVLSCRGLDSRAAKAICDAAGRNPALRVLSLCGDYEALPGTFAGALDRRSKLLEFWIKAKWTTEGFASLVDSLRTNETLRTLHLMPPCGTAAKPIPLELLEDLLTSSNCTLRHVCLPHIADPLQDRLDLLLRRNLSLSRDHGRLLVRRYRFPQRALWPRVAERIGGRMPTLLYRFLRRSNVGDLADQLLLPEAPQPRPAVPAPAPDQRRRKRPADGSPRPLRVPRGV